MKSVWFCKNPRRLLPLSCCAAWVLVLAVLGAAPAASARAPEWLRAAARTPLPAYPATTPAVLLYDERITTVAENGEVKTVYRRAYKILRPQGRELGLVSVPYDTETKLTFLKGWCISAQGDEYEVKEKDAVETQIFNDALFSDNREKFLALPYPDPGNVVGYEFEQKRRESLFQDLWMFQNSIPVRVARYVLQLPPGWEHVAVWLNHTELPPRATGSNQWTWEVEEVPAIEPEPAMPHLAAVAATLAITYFPGGAPRTSRSPVSWSEVGDWYGQLAYPQRQSSPEIRRKALELTAGAATPFEKIQRLATFVQRQVRYVAISIGVGGYVPHAAPEVMTNRYGDCKDKATLLSALLQEVGVESYYVLVNVERGAVSPSFPVWSFNHVILAIRLPVDAEARQDFAVVNHPQLGRLLFFDPTSSLTPLGYLPVVEQASHGLLVTEKGGELLQLPLLPPATNRLLRTGQFKLGAGGSLTGEVQEVRWGGPATDRRSMLLGVPAADRNKVLERFLGSQLTGFQLLSSGVENLDRLNENLLLQYRFFAETYAQKVGNLLLVRLRVLGEKGSDLLEGKPRKYPFEFEGSASHTDVYEFVIPPGYEVDELPPPVDVVYSFGEYHSRVEMVEETIRYTRTILIKDIRVPVERIEELRKFYRVIANDERANAVLKKNSD